MDFNLGKLVVEPTPGYMASQQIHRPKKGKELGFWVVLAPCPVTFAAS